MWPPRPPTPSSPSKSSSERDGYWDSALSTEFDGLKVTHRADTLRGDDRVMKLWQRRCLLAMALVALAYLTHPLWQPVPMHRGRPVRDWVRDAMDGENWGNTIEARRVVSEELAGRAVPDFIRELEARCHSKFYYQARQWQYRLPQWCWILPEPKDTRDSINAAGFALLQMGEPARPAIPALVRCVDQAPMSFAESQEVVGEIIFLGPAASEALPLLRRMASNPKHPWAVQAALAAYAAADLTNLLAETLGRAMSKPGGYDDFARQLFWFRNDEELNRIVVPLLATVLTNGARPLRERTSIAWYLGEVRTSDPLPRTTLKLLLERNPEEELRNTVLEALQELDKVAETNSP